MVADFNFDVQVLKIVLGLQYDIILEYADRRQNAIFVVPKTTCDIDYMAWGGKQHIIILYPCE